MAHFDRAILPGGAGQIVVSLKTAQFQGKIRKSAVVHSNDKYKKSTRIEVRAFVQVPITVFPRGVMLSGHPGEVIQKIVTIKAHEKLPLILEPSENTLSDKVAYELETVEPGKLFRLVLTNISPSDSKYSGKITLKTNYPQKQEILIPLLGYIRTDQKSQPEKGSTKGNGGKENKIGFHGKAAMGRAVADSDGIEERGR